MATFLGSKRLNHSGCPANPGVDIIARPGRAVAAEDVVALGAGRRRPGARKTDTSVVVVFRLLEAGAFERMVSRYRIRTRIILPHAQ